MNPDIEQLQARITALENEVRSLHANSTIPYDVDNAFRTRFGIDGLSFPITTGKDVATETQAVAESGTASYSVAKPMDGFLLKVEAGTALYIPYYLLS